jgi:hypothetical protein
MSDEIADVLDDAADLLERDGWIKNDLRSPLGRCSMGVLLESAAHVQYRLAARDALAEQLGIEPGTRGRVWLADWNDAPERTKQQVLDAFRLAAKAERMPPETPAPPGTPDPRGVGTGLPGDAPKSG